MNKYCKTCWTSRRKPIKNRSASLVLLLLLKILTGHSLNTGKNSKKKTCKLKQSCHSLPFLKTLLWPNYAHYLKFSAWIQPKCYHFFSWKSYYLLIDSSKDLPLAQARRLSLWYGCFTYGWSIKYLQLSHMIPPICVSETTKDCTRLLLVLIFLSYWFARKSIWRCGRSLI